MIAVLRDANSVVHRGVTSAQSVKPTDLCRDTDESAAIARAIATPSGPPGPRRIWLSR